MNPKVEIALDSNLCGTWYCKSDETWDYIGAEYSVSIKNGEFHVSGKDTSDGEEFEVSDICWNGISLTFHGYMPSTGRCSLNQIRYIGGGRIEFLFTFIEREIWTRKDG